MALTKKMLQAMGIEDAQIEQIIEAHRETINGLTETRDSLQAELDKANEEVKRLSTVEKDLVKANAKLEEAEETSKKLKDLQKEYSDYKADVDAKATEANKAKAYKELLTKAGIPEKRHDAILKVTDLNAIDLDKDGKISNEKELTANIDSEWSDFKVTTSEQGAKTATPPDGGDDATTFDKMSLAEKMAYANDNPDDADVKAWLK